jgi:probable rRNA maturation factor
MSLEVEVIGAGAPAEAAELCALALASAGIADGHLALELVDAERIRALNSDHRGVDAPTDVLSFPVDEDGAPHGPRELGDVVICLEHTRDVREAVVHGVLHLVGMDHEQDEGEMLALQAELLAWTCRGTGAEPART